jgi:hydrogenase-4 component F
MYNSLNKVVLFLSAGSVRQKYKTRNSDAVSSVLDVMPWTGWIFLFSFLAVSAVPPFGMFFSELKIFQGMLFSGRPWVLAATMFFMLFIFINMARIIMRMLYRKDDKLQLPEAGEGFNVIHAASLILLLLLVVLALFTPNVVRETIFDIAKNFGVNV